MNRISLAAAIRSRASALRNADESPLTVGALADDAELLRVLAHIVEGKDLRRAFGAPGDWGYETDIGSALADIPAKAEAEKAGGK
jgi:hypothetical protein